MDAMLRLDDDEQVIDKRADYDEKQWLLLVVKGHKASGEKPPAPFGERLTGLPVDDARRLANALSKAAAAFASALDEPAKATSGEMC
ncbi:MAG: hypothetical protein EPN91_13050 [Salinibacterium sp.]|nr:MAG: hypothetical protein EPN91_13050 [Salinibacterium sp.]